MIVHARFSKTGALYEVLNEQLGQEQRQCSRPLPVEHKGPLLAKQEKSRTMKWYIDLGMLLLHMQTHAKVRLIMNSLACNI